MLITSNLTTHIIVRGEPVENRRHWILPIAEIVHPTANSLVTHCVHDPGPPIQTAAAMTRPAGTRTRSGRTPE
ncbi:hypothetical protein GCM10010492_09560 [Saccharothrix mutabilis subsp. mutabilis]|uniref:Uncharacterized protein n=1 Tax=Saccharothrix mutabilis subsp. mutabilis TaxID=66855 RepID=A0ABP3CRU9_9PSEU